MTTSRPLTIIEGEIVHDREMAWCYRLPDGRDVWVPKSVGHKSQDERLMVPGWLIEKEDLGEWAR